MRIAWENGYQSAPYPTDVAVVCAKGYCNACRLGKSDSPSDVPVVVFDSSAGEYTPVQLCLGHLIELAFELSQVK